MRREAVRSSNVASVGWEQGPPPWTGTLEIEFTSSAVYQYSGVAAAIAFRVLVGDGIGSVGKAFHALIRGQYPYRRVA